MSLQIFRIIPHTARVGVIALFCQLSGFDELSCRRSYEFILLLNLRVFCRSVLLMMVSLILSSISAWQLEAMNCMSVNLFSESLDTSKICWLDLGIKEALSVGPSVSPWVRRFSKTANSKKFKGKFNKILKISRHFASIGQSALFVFPNPYLSSL